MLVSTENLLFEISTFHCIVILQQMNIPMFIHHTEWH